METEVSGKISFLDCLISREDNVFTTSVYRKPTFSGLGMSFFSYCSPKFKINFLQTLLFRGYNISSNYFKMHIEFEFLKDFFIKNGFPIGLINREIKKILQKYFENNSKRDYQTAKPSFYFSLPYFGKQSEKLKKELYLLLSNCFVNRDIRIVLVNNFRIGSFFNYKDKLPKQCQSSLVYKYSCARCASEYVGSTIRTLQSRVDEHCGRSSRTGLLLSKPPLSSIREHAKTCSLGISLEDFKILGKEKDLISLRILESLHIYKTRPSLNDMKSAFPLNLINR